MSCIVCVIFLVMDGLENADLQLNDVLLFCEMYVNSLLQAIAFQENYL